MISEKRKEEDFLFFFFFTGQKFLGTLSTWCPTVAFDVGQVQMFILWERTDVLKWGKEMQMFWEKEHATKIPFHFSVFFPFFLRWAETLHVTLRNNNTQP